MYILLLFLLPCTPAPALLFIVVEVIFTVIIFVFINKKYIRQ